MMNIIDYMCLDTTPRHIKKMYLENFCRSFLTLTSDDMSKLLDLYDSMNVSPDLSLFDFVKHNIPYRAGIEDFWTFEFVSYKETKYLLEQWSKIWDVENEDDRDFCLEYLTRSISDVLTNFHKDLPCDSLRSTLQEGLAFEVNTFPYSWKADAECYAASILLPDETLAIFYNMNKTYSAFSNESCLFNNILRQPNHPLFDVVVHMANEYPSLVSSLNLSRAIHIDVPLPQTRYFVENNNYIGDIIRFPISFSHVVFTALPMSSQLAVYQKMEKYSCLCESFLHHLADEYHYEDRNFDGIESVLSKIRSQYKDVWTKNVPLQPKEFLHYVNFLNTEVRQLLNTIEMLQHADIIVDNNYSSYNEHVKLRSCYDRGEVNTMKAQEETSIIF